MLFLRFNRTHTNPAKLIFRAYFGSTLNLSNSQKSWTFSYTQSSTAIIREAPPLYGAPYRVPGLDEIEEMFTLHHAKGWISDMKWSPDGSTLAAGSHDNKIYIYDVYPACERIDPSENEPTVHSEVRHELR